ncbi:MAG: hypothetical protein IT207_00550 [Fimbriimonadaceae bacterium]|nr:hypothetical protein [Fimbriimonadaceae bacterium]
MTSVACLDPSGVVLRELSELSPRAATPRITELVREALAGEKPERIAVDVGPGGFTAVRTGMALGKSLAWAWGLELAALSAFDLVSRTGPVAIPAKKGSWWLRAPGLPPVLVTDPGDATGYGLPSGLGCYPFAREASSLLDTLVWGDPAGVLPDYLAEPTISTPKPGKYPPAAPPR